MMFAKRISLVCPVQGPMVQRLRDEESGQAMTEFALVLPILALLTFGTMEVAIYLQQQSTLNAAAFVAARAASVLGNEKGPATEAANSYVDSTGMPWLKRAASTMKADNADNRSRYKLDASADRFTGLIAALSGGEVKGFDTLTASATLPLEYARKSQPNHTGNVTYKPMTHYQIDYHSEVKPPTSVNLLPKNIQDLTEILKPIETGIDKFNKLIAKIPRVPKVVPTPKPTAAPTPKPRPSGGPGMATPGPKPPAAKPTPPPNPWAGWGPIEKPKIIETLKGIPLGTADEPFSGRGAVMKNPHDKGSGGGYIHPTYEEEKPKKLTDWNIMTLFKGLEKFEVKLKGGAAKGNKNGLDDICRAVANIKLPPMPAGGQAVAPYGAAYIALQKSIDQARKLAGQFSQGILKGADNNYKTLLKEEGDLFPK